MKHCNYCNEDRPEEDFHWRNRVLGIRIARCKFCWSKYTKEHYQKNKKMYLDKAKKCNSTKRDDFIKFLLDYFKTHPCVDCGEQDSLVLQFDHVYGKKRFNISNAAGYRNQLTMLEEMAKCEVRCANCHLRKTAQRGSFRKLRFASMM